MEMYDGEGRLLDIDFPRVIFSFVPRGWNASINKKLFGLIYIYILSSNTNIKLVQLTILLDHFSFSINSKLTKIFINI